MTAALEERNVNYALLRVERDALNARGITTETERYVFVQVSCKYNSLVPTFPPRTCYFPARGAH